MSTILALLLAAAPAAQALSQSGPPALDAPEPGPAEAWLLPLRGEVLVRSEGETEFRDPGASRTELRPGSVVRVGRRAAARIELSDGSFLHLSSMTAIAVGNERWLRLLGGNVRASFKRHLLKGEWKLRIPPSAVVRGTGFTIATSGKDEKLAAPPAAPEGPSRVVAQIEMVHGTVERRTSKETTALLGAADIAPGTIVATREASGAALRLHGNAKAKLWPRAALGFEDSTPVLLAGRLTVEGPPVAVRLLSVGGATGAFSVESRTFDAEGPEPASCGAAVRLCAGPPSSLGEPDSDDWPEEEGLELGVCADGVATLLDESGGRRRDPASPGLP